MDDASLCVRACRELPAGLIELALIAYIAVREVLNRRKTKALQQQTAELQQTVQQLSLAPPRVPIAIQVAHPLVSAFPPPQRPSQVSAESDAPTAYPPRPPNRHCDDA